MKTDSKVIGAGLLREAEAEKEREDCWWARSRKDGGRFQKDVLARDEAIREANMVLISPQPR